MVYLCRFKNICCLKFDFLFYPILLLYMKYEFNCLRYFNFYTAIIQFQKRKQLLIKLKI